MDNRTIIQKSLDYIEDNLQTEITAAELAEMAGFSLFHYYRLFLHHRQAGDAAYAGECTASPACR